VEQDVMQHCWRALSITWIKVKLLEMALELFLRVYPKDSFLALAECHRALFTPNCLDYGHNTVMTFSATRVPQITIGKIQEICCNYRSTMK